MLKFFWLILFVNTFVSILVYGKNQTIEQQRLFVQTIFNYYAPTLPIHEKVSNVESKN